MANNNKFDEGADFSGYLKKDEPAPVTPEALSPIQESPHVIRFTRRAKYLLAFLVLLAIIQSVLVLVVNKRKPAQIPDGYRLVTPVNQPAYIELDK